jgi:DNA N-6-adenine-methyltransferase (Dam)
MTMRFGRADTGSTVEWYTPPEIFESLGITFDVDPCAPPGGLPWVPAARFYSQADDGLRQPWAGRVWLNPPYGAGIELWMEKLAAHGNGIALVHARTSTVWWRTAMSTATAVCFVAGGVRFMSDTRGSRPAGSSPLPVVLLAYGLVCATALMQSGLGPCLIVPPGTAPGESFAQRARKS